MLSKSFRVRSLYFLSLGGTVACLAVLGLLLSPALQPSLSPGPALQLRILTLALHVFSVQFGLQTLPGQLTDILLPSSVRPVLKAGCISNLNLF